MMTFTRFVLATTSVCFIVHANILKPLQNRIACVTGATRGIGKGIAISLADAGATVYITGRSDESGPTDKILGGTLAEVVKEIESRNGKCVGIRVDHKNDEDVKNFFQKVDETVGGLDILVNNAFELPSDSANSSATTDVLFQKFWEQPGYFYDAIMDVGLRSHYISTVYAFPLLKRRKISDPSSTPTIFHISSFGGASYSFNVAYGVGKAGVDRMARDMAKELASEGNTVLFISPISQFFLNLKSYLGISCFSIYPGVVRTERMAPILSSGNQYNQCNF